MGCFIVFADVDGLRSVNTGLITEGLLSDAHWSKILDDLFLGRISGGPQPTRSTALVPPMPAEKQGKKTLRNQQIMMSVSYPISLVLKFQIGYIKRNFQRVSCPKKGKYKRMLETTDRNLMHIFRS
jgi:hypothetical protein